MSKIYIHGIKTGAATFTRNNPRVLQDHASFSLKITASAEKQ